MYPHYDALLFTPFLAWLIAVTFLLYLTELIDAFTALWRWVYNREPTEPD